MLLDFPKTPTPSCPSSVSNGFGLDEPLSLSTLVTLEVDLQPYVLEWPSVPDSDGISEAQVLVVFKRQGGFLVAVPAGFIPQSVLDRANQGVEAGPVGASASLVVPGIIVDNGVRSLTGQDLEVVVVDFSADLVSQLRPMEEVEDIVVSFDPESSFTLPSPPDLLSAARDWILGAGEETGLAFYSAGGEVDSAPAALPSVDSPAVQPETPVRRTRKTAKATGTPFGGGGGGEKPKRVTAASLAASMDQMMQVVPTLSNQIQELSQRYQVLEERIAVPHRASALGLSRPLSSTMGPKAVGAGAVASALTVPPPRTSAQAPLGMLASPKFQPEELQALEEEKEPLQPEGDLAKAVLAQSQALTALVSQISQSGQDPMLDLSGSSSSTSTRGATGRARLQAELATHSGAFFNAVLRSMARRMQPTTPVSGSAEELLSRGVCGTQYMERYGGFGRHRDLGLIQYQIMTAMDFLQAGNMGAAKDSIALLAVCIDQAVLDGGRFDLAALLTLQEDPPSTIFLSRQQSTLSRARAFSQLADQRWVTVALAFVKELDLITTKRQELAGQGAQKPSTSVEPSAKPKANAKRKGKGAGKNAGGGGLQEAEEE